MLTPQHLKTYTTLHRHKNNSADAFAFKKLWFHVRDNAKHATGRHIHFPSN